MTYGEQATLAAKKSRLTKSGKLDGRSQYARELRKRGLTESFHKKLEETRQSKYIGKDQYKKEETKKPSLRLKHMEWFIAVLVLIFFVSWILYFN